MTDDRTGEFRSQLVMLPEFDLSWVTFSGSLSFRQMAITHKNYLAHPDYRAGLGELQDFRRATLGQVSLDEASALREYVKGTPESVQGSTVMVVDDELQYGVGRMITTMIEDNVPLQRSVAYSIEEALEWLRPGKAEEIVSLYQRRPAIDLLVNP